MKKLTLFVFGAAIIIGVGFFMMQNPGLVAVSSANTAAGAGSASTTDGSTSSNRTIIADCGSLFLTVVSTDDASRSCNQQSRAEEIREDTVIESRQSNQ